MLATFKKSTSATMFVGISFTMLLLPFAHVISCDNRLEARTDCNAGYTQCSPNGAMATNEPPVGSGLSTMYVDVVNSVQATGKQKRECRLVELKERASGGSLCCTSTRLMGVKTLVCSRTDVFLGNDGTQCLLLQGYDLAFCYVRVSNRSRLNFY